jgi:hypothetical protein
VAIVEWDDDQMDVEQAATDTDANAHVATPLWPSVGVKPNTWKSWGFGVLQDSRMFRARQQGAKHLALECSWCRWKGLETYISKMPSHWQFGHLQPKL